MLTQGELRTLSNAYRVVKSLGEVPLAANLAALIARVTEPLPTLSAPETDDEDAEAIPALPAPDRGSWGLSGVAIAVRVVV